MDILKNEQLRAYDKLSRYSSFPFYYNTVDDKYIYGTTNHLKNNTSYQNYQIKKGDTLDSIALKAWNNPTYYWIIADFNRIQDPFINLPVGYTIKIPVLSNIEFKE